MNNMENIEVKHSQIKGWAVDANPQNEPTYPIKKYTGDDHKRIRYERPPLQKQTVEILHSNERPGLTAVYGTSVPPSGLSGIIRRRAFKHSESSYNHWLPLLLADRINVIEGVFNDLFHGRIPNVFVERGWKADLKYQPAVVVRKVFVYALITAAITTILVRKRRK